MTEDYWFRHQIAACLTDCIIAQNALRNHPGAWAAVHPDPETPEGRAYAELSAEVRRAEGELWLATDVEYAEDGFRDAVWSWRYWKVMARKCCWSQRHGSADYAAFLIRELTQAEAKFAEVCGLAELYTSAQEHLQKVFPGLKAKAP